MCFSSRLKSAVAGEKALGSGDVALGSRGKLMHSKSENLRYHITHTKKRPIFLVRNRRVESKTRRRDAGHRLSPEKRLPGSTGSTPDPSFLLPASEDKKGKKPSGNLIGAGKQQEVVGDGTSSCQSIYFMTVYPYVADTASARHSAPHPFPRRCLLVKRAGIRQTQ
jgi:hypothetical protein